MIKNILADSHPSIKFIIAVFIMLTIFLVSIIIGAFVSIPVFNISLSNIQEVLNNPLNPDNINVLKFFQIIQTIGLFVIPPFLIVYIIDDTSSIKYLQLKNRVSVKSILLVILIMAAALPIINFLAKINSEMKLPDVLSGLEQNMKNSELSAQKLIEAFLNVKTTGGLFFNIFMIAVLPAIGEELVFRGVMQKIFTEWTKNIHWGIIISAFFFSFIHFQFYGFIPRMMMGVLFGYLLVWSGSICLPIIAHFINNSIAVVFYYYYGDKMTEQIDNLGATEGSFIYLFLSIICLSIFLYGLYRINKKQVPEKI